MNMFAVAEMVRNAIADFPVQYLTAAKVCGLSQKTILLHIQLPLLLRELIPPVLSQQIVVLQASLLTSLIGVDEVFRTAQRLNAVLYQPIPIYTSLAVLLLAICLPLNWAVYRMKKQFTRNLSER
jgi:ABC-type amino acid transport system permease subunit